MMGQPGLRKLAFGYNRSCEVETLGDRGNRKYLGLSESDNLRFVVQQALNDLYCFPVYAPCTPT